MATTTRIQTKPFRDHTSRPQKIRRSLLLILALSIPAMLTVVRSPGSDLDIWWQLRVGEWILQHRAFPWTDPFSRLGLGHPWQAYSWLFDLIVLRLYTAFGLYGLSIYTTGMVLAITAALYRLVSYSQRDPRFAGILALLAAVSFTRLATPRPWHFTILFFILQLDVLQRARGRGDFRRLLWLLPLYAVWANLHIQFIDGLVVLVISALEPVLSRYWPWPEPARISATKLIWITAGCLAATLLNPYGWHIYQTAFALASQSGVLNIIAELMAPGFRSWLDYLMLAITVSAYASMAWRRHFPLWQTLLMCIGTYLSFRSRRDIWFVVVVATVVLSSELQTRPEDQETPEYARSMSLNSRSRKGRFVIAIVCIVFVFSVLRMRNTNAELQERVGVDFPVAAIDFIRSHGYPGPLFNDYKWGGFLIWQLRMPVAIDGRAALYGDSLIDRSIQTWTGQPGWEEDSQLQSARLVIARLTSPLTQLLKTDSQFRLVYEDKVAAVFVRN